MKQRTEKEFERHRDDLSKTAREVLEKLCELSRYVPLPKPVVCEFAVDYDERDFLDVLDNNEGNHLLEHMQSELLELQEMKSWADIKVNAITDELLDRLSRWIAGRDFEGTCDICREWK